MRVDLLESHFRFLAWLVPTVERFSRSQKFLLGDRIQDTALNVLKSLIETTDTRQCNQHLSQASSGLEKMRLLLRFARELHYLNRRCFRTYKETRLAIFEYIEGWYNPHRRHSSIAYHAPMAYKKQHQKQA